MIHVSGLKTIPVGLGLVNIRKTANLTFIRTGVSGDVSIVFTNNEEITRLNKEYRKIDAVTDVLSFPTEELDPVTQKRYLGDIVISVEKAIEQSRSANRPPADEITMLIVHGCLHLSGFDHANEEEKKTMKNYQESILSELEVANPSWPEDER